MSQLFGIALLIWIAWTWGIWTAIGFWIFSLIILGGLASLACAVGEAATGWILIVGAIIIIPVLIVWFGQ
jgi:hypothetical protein